MPEFEKRFTPDGDQVPFPSDNDVLYELGDGFAWITRNRPLILNAVDWSVRRGLARALTLASQDADVRAVVLRGAGRAFSAGGDLQAWPEPEDGVETPAMLDIVGRIWSLPKPVIAAVRGPAVGLGFELAGVCDLTLAADDAKFGEIQIRHGFGPPILIAPFLAGLKGAKEILMLGDILTAQDAQRLGVVNHIVPSDAVFDEAAALAKKFAALPAATVGLNKALVNRVYELAGVREALDYRSDATLEALSDRTRDDDIAAERLKVLESEGWEAFIKKRDEAFGGPS